MSSSMRSDSDYFSAEFDDDDDGMSTSSTESSEDEESDFIDVENGEPDSTWVMQRKRASGKVQKPEKKKKKNHNASEKNRREQLALCFLALKDSMNQPHLTNNVALKKAATLIQDLQAKEAALINKLERLSQNRVTSNRQINKSRKSR